MQAAKWSIEEYTAIVDAGLLEDRHVELIDGQITEMSPANNPHDSCLALLAYELGQRLYGKYFFRSEKGLRIPSLDSIPEPDFAVVKLRDDHYLARKPEPPDVILLIEVADPSLAYDRKIKGELYAAAGIAEYWIFDLRDSQVEIYRLSETEEKHGDPEIFPRARSIDHPILSEVVLAEFIPK